MKKTGEILDSVHLRMPVVTRWVGRIGVLLGPVLGLLHMLVAAMMPAYGQRVLEQYDAVQRTGDLLAAPAAQYFILVGFALCVIWIVLQAVRMGLALRGWIVRRRSV